MNTPCSHCLNKFNETHKRDGENYIYYHTITTHSFRRKKNNIKIRRKIKLCTYLPNMVIFGFSVPIRLLLK